jgi:hypothetical protein
MRESEMRQKYLTVTFRQGFAQQNERGATNGVSLRAPVGGCMSRDTCSLSPHRSALTPQHVVSRWRWLQVPWERGGVRRNPITIVSALLPWFTLSLIPLPLSVTQWLTPHRPII